MITSDRMAAVDANAAALGVPQKQLMESSGNAIARQVETLADSGDTVLIVAGRGNNGGDGFVAARFLDAYDVTVCLLGRPETIRTDIARENWDALESGAYDTQTVTDSTACEPAITTKDPDLVVDAMLGTGVTGALREPEATAAAVLNETSATVVSVDVPSGIDADTGDADGESVSADHIVTFHDEKPGLEALDATVTVADIGIPDTAELFVERGDLLGLRRESDSHKGDHGEVLVVGGGPYTGAPVLSAQAALRAGADLVRVACPETITDSVQGFGADLIVRPLPGDSLQPGHVDRLLELGTDQDVVLLGPGLGTADGTHSAVREFLGAYEGQCVVDADALSVVPDVDTDATLVCTPHRGELREMGGEAPADWRERVEAVGEFAADLDVTMLVKGPDDVISDGTEHRVNRTGNPGMTVGGTGDVLAGATAALVSVLGPLQGAAVGAYATGRAGDIAADTTGYGLLASDLPDLLPDVLWGQTDE
jgi:NAD(P)H-hydrate epimerase